MAKKMIPKGYGVPKGDPKMGGDDAKKGGNPFAKKTKKKKK